MRAESLTRIVVASKNPVKAGAIEDAFKQHFPGRSFEIEKLSAASGVPDQPMSDEETQRGALNRLTAVRAARPQAEIWAALEGGIEDSSLHGMHAFAWIIIETSQQRGLARTATFPLPDAVARLVRAGTELGHVNDQVFGRENSKQKEGAIGILSGGLIDRRELYSHAALLAMVPIKQAKLFES